MLLVHMGSAEEGEAFFAKRWPEARAIADPHRSIYRALALRRGGLADFLSPRVLLAGVRDFLKGHGVGKPVGDPRQMPGVVLIEGTEIVREHRFGHAADHPDWVAFARG